MVKHPNDDSLHVATRLCSWNFSGRLTYITGVSARPRSIPTFQDYLESTRTQLTKGAQRHHVSGLQPQGWEQLITEQWQSHCPESQYLLSMQDAEFIISVVRGSLVQGREYAPDDLHVFCGINKNATVPISCVLLKKKQFAVARPIISYSSFIFGRLFRAASTLLNILFPAVYPGSFGLQTLPEIFKELHAFLCNAPIGIHLQQHNQDLVGFFH